MEPSVKERYEELKSNYKISRRSVKWNSESRQYDPINRDDYDVVVQFVEHGYAHEKYTVLKNKPNLGTKDLAIICSDGWLPWGYRMDCGYICVHTD